MIQKRLALGLGPVKRWIRWSSIFFAETGRLVAVLAATTDGENTDITWKHPF